jgi:hypothetical protein
MERDMRWFSGLEQLRIRILSSNSLQYQRDIEEYKRERERVTTGESDVEFPRVSRRRRKERETKSEKERVRERTRRGEGSAEPEQTRRCAPTQSHDR